MNTDLTIQEPTANDTTVLDYLQSDFDQVEKTVEAIKDDIVAAENEIETVSVTIPDLSADIVAAEPVPDTILDLSSDIIAVVQTPPLVDNYVKSQQTIATQTQQLLDEQQQLEDGINKSIIGLARLEADKKKLDDIINESPDSIEIAIESPITPDSEESEYIKGVRLRILAAGRSRFNASEDPDDAEIARLRAIVAAQNRLILREQQRLADLREDQQINIAQQQQIQVLNLVDINEEDREMIEKRLATILAKILKYNTETLERKAQRLETIKAYLKVEEEHAKQRADELKIKYAEFTEKFLTALHRRQVVPVVNADPSVPDLPPTYAAYLEQRQRENAQVAVREPSALSPTAQCSSILTIPNTLAILTLAGSVIGTTTGVVYPSTVMPVVTRAINKLASSAVNEYKRRSPDPDDDPAQPRAKRARTHLGTLTDVLTTGVTAANILRAAGCDVPSAISNPNYILPMVNTLDAFYSEITNTRGDPEQQGLPPPHYTITNPPTVRARVAEYATVSNVLKAIAAGVGLLGLGVAYRPSLLNAFTPAPSLYTRIQLSKDKFLEYKILTENTTGNTTFTAVFNMLRRNKITRTKNITSNTIEKLTRKIQTLINIHRE